jgi:group I intron endonuclease
MFGIIYCIENTINGYKYIGQTSKTLEERVAEHYKFSKYEYSQGRALYQAINKYGKENFIAYEVDVANTQEELDEKETYWIEKFNTYLGRGYNMSPGGQLERKNHANQEISNKLSETFGGREFLVYDMEGNFIKSVVSQTAFA